MTEENAHGAKLLARDQVEVAVRAAVAEAVVFDIHTHICEPRFGGLLLRGIDELLTYHYLIAEVTRATGLDPARCYRMSKQAQAELVWDELFLKRSPVSEAARGVITAVTAYGLDARPHALPVMRRVFRSALARGARGPRLPDREPLPRRYDQRPLQRRRARSLGEGRRRATGGSSRLCASIRWWSTCRARRSVCASGATTSRRTSRAASRRSISDGFSRTG